MDTSGSASDAPSSGREGAVADSLQQPEVRRNRGASVQALLQPPVQDLPQPKAQASPPDPWLSRLLAVVEVPGLMEGRPQLVQGDQVHIR